uniref:hypothetical protein n=1 Tax=Pelomonas sp. KK5 TaxID=1855730 RepID=UPI00097C873D
PLPPDSLRLGHPLPFAVRNAEGRLLLASGQLLQDGPLATQLLGGGGWVQAHEILAYQKALAHKADTLVRQGAAISEIAQARADFHPERAAPKADHGERAAWADLQGRLHLLLRDPHPDEARCEAVRSEALARLAQRPDATLMLLVFECSQAFDPGSQGLLGLALAELAAKALGKPDEERIALTSAALRRRSDNALLERIARLCERLGPLAGRPALSGAAAMRMSWLDAAGQPDEAGSALVKVLGLYPPGSVVRLAQGEIGIVFRRGATATEPMVAALIGKSGTPLTEPVPRDTRLQTQAVAAALAPQELKLRVNVDRLLKLYQL